MTDIAVFKTNDSSFTETPVRATSNAMHVVDQTSWPDFNAANTARKTSQLGGTPTNLTASGAVSAVAGTLIGFYVNSTSSGTLIVKDGGSGGTALSGTITPDKGYHAFPAKIGTSCYFTIANTLNITGFFLAD